MNSQTDQIAIPHQRCLLFLSYIRGNLVDDWVDEVMEWINDELTGGRDPREEFYWTTVKDKFINAFTDSAEKQKAAAALENLRMEKGNLDDYIATFISLSRKAGFHKNEEGNLKQFSSGLPEGLVRDIIKHERPLDWDDWVNGARKHQQDFINLSTRFGIKNKSHLSKGQWRNAFAVKHDPNAMNVDRTKKGTTVRAALTDAEKAKLQSEGRCFRCKKQGHISRNCPDRPAQASTSTTAPEPPKTDEERAEEVWKNILAQSEGVRAALAEKAFEKKDFS